MAKKKKRKPVTKKHSFQHQHLDHDYFEDVKPVKAEDEFNFHCSCCGECCRNVKDAIMLESLDIFRISRYFKQIGNPVQSIEEILEGYTMIMPLTDFGYPIFLLKTTGPKNECIFLNSGKCSIQAAKPRTCRLYPLSAGPGETDDSFRFVIVSERQHHFTGQKIQVGDWIDENFSPEDREFISMEYETAKELGKLLRKLKDKGMEERQVLFPLLLYKYFEFDVEEPFMPQYSNNFEKLIRVLMDLAKE